MPNLENIKIFGSLAFNKEPSNFTKKLDSKATPYYLIGFIGSNIYKLCNPKTNKVITSRDCKIIEGYYYKPNNSSNIQEIFTKLDSSKTTSNNKSKDLEPKPKSYKSPIIDDYSEDELALNTIIVEEANNLNSTSNTIELDKVKQDWKSLYNYAIISNLTSSNIEPKSYKEVLLRKDKDLYLNAMKLEVDDLLNNNT
jgi:hypothetical protein